MWPAVITIYILGVALTALNVLNDPVTRSTRLISAGSILLWPFYWSLFLGTRFMNRRRL